MQEKTKNIYFKLFKSYPMGNTRLSARGSVSSPQLQCSAPIPIPVSVANTTAN